MAAEYPPRDRLSLRAYIRARLRGRGLLEFADDDEDARISADLVYMNCERSWYEDARSRTNLELEALLATSTDVPMQCIDNTVQNNDEFWSSTGSPTGAAGEALLYRLRQPLSHVAYVSLAVYRASYQHGDPLYPPRKVSFLTGPSPNQLYPASPIYPVRLTDEVQVFGVSPTAAVSQYLMIRLHGRLQRQWEDLQFYIAIRHVAAYGDPVALSYSIQMARLVRTRGLAWPCTRGLASAAATEGQGEDRRQAAPYGGTYDDGGAGGASRRPLTMDWRAGRDPRQERILAEDVCEVGPLSTAESRRVYVTAAPHRCRTPPRASELVSEHATEGMEQDEDVFPGRSDRPWRRHRAVLWTGPTSLELRQAVQFSALQRALPHLVHVTWPEALVTKQHQYRQYRIPQHQRRQAQQERKVGKGTAAAGWRSIEAFDFPWRAGQLSVPETAAARGNGAAAAASWGLFRLLGRRPFAAPQSLGELGPQGHGRRPSPPRPRMSGGMPDDDSSIGNLREELDPHAYEYGVDGGGGGSVPSGIGAAEAGVARQRSGLQRLRQWVVAAARGTAVAVEHADSSLDKDKDNGDDAVDDVEEEEEGATEPRSRWLRRWWRIGGGGGAASIVRLSGNDPNPRCQHPNDEEKEEEGGNDAAAAAVAAADASTNEPSITAGSAARQLFPGSPASAAARAARLHALALPYQRPRNLTPAPNDPMVLREQLQHLRALLLLLLQQKEEEGHQARRHVAVVAGEAAAASTSALALGANTQGHTRPQQPLPPPKLRRRGDVGLVRTGAAVRATVGGGNGGDVQRQRRCHQRAAQRAMQPALYHPYKSSALFVALEAWAGVRSNSSVVPEEVDNNGNSVGSWLVSHYDHEHL